VNTLEELAPFVEDAKKSGRGMRGDILEIQGMPLAFWSHLDVLNAEFGTGVYEKQYVLLRGMDGHTSWANRALLQRAGITAEFLKKLSAGERSYYGFDKDMQPNGFLVDAARRKSSALASVQRRAVVGGGAGGFEIQLQPGHHGVARSAGGRLCFAGLQDAGGPGRADFGGGGVSAGAGERSCGGAGGVQKAREAYKNVANLHVTGIKVFADGVVEFPSQTAHLSKPYKNNGTQWGFAV